MMVDRQTPFSKYLALEHCPCSTCDYAAVAMDVGAGRNADQGSDIMPAAAFPGGAAECVVEAACTGHFNVAIGACLVNFK